jgi:hypothetical protein
MKDMGERYGSSAWASPVVVTDDCVYVHTDIEQVAEINGEAVTDCYKYHEFQYSAKEYIEMIGKENSTLKSQMETTQKALDSLLLGGE